MPRKTSRKPTPEVEVEETLDEIEDEPSSGAGRPRVHKQTVAIHFRCDAAFRDEIGRLADRFRAQYRSRAGFHLMLFERGVKQWVRDQWHGRGPEDRTPTAGARFAFRLGLRFDEDGRLCLPVGSGRLPLTKGRARPRCSFGGLDPLLLALLQYHGDAGMRKAKQVEFVNGDVCDLRKQNLRFKKG